MSDLHKVETLCLCKLYWKWLICKMHFVEIIRKTVRIIMQKKTMHDNIHRAATNIVAI